MPEIEWSFGIQVGESGPNITVPEPRKVELNSLDRLRFDVPAGKSKQVSAEPEASSPKKDGGPSTEVGFLLVRILPANEEEAPAAQLEYSIRGTNHKLDAPLVLAGAVAGELPGGQPNSLGFRNNGELPVAVEVLIGRRSAS